MSYTTKETTEILNDDNKDEKISLLSNLTETTDSEIIMQVISALDDNEIRVRGEAFSSLLLNKNNISEFLIQSLTSDNNNRGFSALVLANRGDSNAIPALKILTEDNSSIVRSYALGALEYLRANKVGT